MSQPPVDHHRGAGPASAAVRLRLGIVPRSCVVELSGDFDVDGADEQLARLPCATDLVLDLSRVGFFGATGLTLLTTLSHRLARNGAGLCLIGVPPTVRRLILVLGLRDALPCEPMLSCADAVEEFDPISRPRRLRDVASDRAGRPASVTRLPHTGE